MPPTSDYQERETLDDILAAWREETPVPQEVQRQVEAELDHVGLTGQPGGGDASTGGSRPAAASPEAIAARAEAMPFGEFLPRLPAGQPTATRLGAPAATAAVRTQGRKFP